MDQDEEPEAVAAQEEEVVPVAEELAAIAEAAEVPNVPESVPEQEPGPSRMRTRSTSRSERSPPPEEQVRVMPRLSESAPVVTDRLPAASSATIRSAREAAPSSGAVSRGYYHPNEVNNPMPVPGLADYAGEGISNLKSSGHQSMAEARRRIKAGDHWTADTLT